MSQAQETRPNAATPRWAKGTAALNTAAAPTTNSTRSSGKRQDLIVSDFLIVGEAHAVTMRYLKSILHRNDRTIRLMIERERRGGTLILSDNKHGYYLAGNEDEIKKFVCSMRHRATEILHTAAIIEGAIMKNE